jgi:DNA-directed RNA polymerase specialized sigma24 family protein
MAKYIEKKELHDLIVCYVETGSNEAYQKIGEKLLLIASNFLNNSSTINYSKDRKDDMVSDAVFLMLKKIKGYDYTIYFDPFTYFTEIAKNAIRHNFNQVRRNKETFVNLTYIENFSSDGGSD